MSDGSWKVLKEVWNAGFTNLQDIDACRNATWLLYDLSLSDEQGVREELVDAGVFAPLMKSLASNDRIIKRFAAKTLFNLVEGSHSEQSKMLSQVRPWAYEGLASRFYVGLHL